MALDQVGAVGDPVQVVVARPGLGRRGRRRVGHQVLGRLEQLVVEQVRGGGVFGGCAHVRGRVVQRYEVVGGELRLVVHGRVRVYRAVLCQQIATRLGRARLVQLVSESNQFVDKNKCHD
ncbi:hypothetical protein BpHYR1_016715 [Brachionus plicatilis]|uniref:Uncharacterized protein n=1 Tax=Brachionus plicatilis TaxID=10195 RepID=A0A3M7QKG9_BRAPC|nr:hypothetical protein BpHYR1_016715 [Brachionus plicatilis]